MRCLRCKNKLLQKSAEGDVKLRTKGQILFKSDGTCEASCYWCGEPVVIPVALTKAIEPAAPERFVIKA